MTQVLNFDIVISGGSLSAPAAALAAARNAPDARILLIEPTDWLGGQATSQGVSAIDNAWFDPGRTVMVENPEDYYAKDYLEFLKRINDPRAPGERMSENGTCWVSREAFDPRSAAWALDRMIAKFTNITVMKLTVVKNVEIIGGKISALLLVQRIPTIGYKPFDDFLSNEINDWYSAEDSRRFNKLVHRIEPDDGGQNGFVVIDASELADVIVLSGAEYTQGAEVETEEVTAGELPEMDDLSSQATVFVFCMTDRMEDHPEEIIKKHWPDFDAYAEEQDENYFSLRQFTWERVWTYRRLRTEGPLLEFDEVHRGDVSMQNWEPGNDYPYSSFLLGRSDVVEQALIGWQGGVNVETLAQCEKHALAWYFWMKAHRTTPWDTMYIHGNHRLNMMGTRRGLAKFPYVRCARRIVGPGNFRILEKFWKNSQAPDYDGGTSRRFFDSVGIGAYAADVHPVRNHRGMKPHFERPAPFYIPYRALVSKNISNLLACGKNMAQTFITNSAYRLHPIEWASGSAAGTAAGLLLSKLESEPAYFLRNEARLRELQTAVAANSPISWKAWNDTEFPQEPFERPAPANP